MTEGAAGGALVVSLDFELHWGVHDTLGASGGYRENLLGAREAVPRMLELFAEYGVAATWATVGFLFADGREELEAFSPSLRPTYQDPRRDPYRLPVGASESDDPLHFAPSLIRQIAATPRQEVASHTFSHYYCLEPGQTAQQFCADLKAARSIAQAKGYDVRSLVLPRHQVRAEYFPQLRAAGFVAHRTHERNGLNAPNVTGGDPLGKRGLRLLDAYLPLTGANLVEWESARPDEHGLVDVRESRFLRPRSSRLAAVDALRVGRIVSAMAQAARSGHIFHLWWHPHNFGAALAGNLKGLRRVLDAYARLEGEGLMRSLNMGEVADLARRASAAGASAVRQPA